MNLLKLIRIESSISPVKMAVFATIAGLSNALVLAIINTAAEQASDEQASFRYLILFLLTIALYAYSQRFLLLTSNVEVEQVLHKIRIRLSDKIRKSDLLPLEKIGRSEIYASINKETLTISQAAALLVIGLQSCILLLFTVGYIAFLSKTAFFLTVIYTTVALLFYLRRSAQLQEELNEARDEENKLFDTLTGLLDGFKQVKVSSARSNALYMDLERISDQARLLKSNAMTKVTKHMVFSQILFFLLLATTVFVVPRLSSTYSDVVIKSTTAILFMIGPLNTLVAAVPTFANANAAAINIGKLETVLDASVQYRPQNDLDFSSFKEIRFEGVTFRYEDAGANHVFKVGPVDVSFKAGEMVFISGGNGSGKSTFLKLLTALYYPDRGVIRIDDKVLGETNYQAYRNIFSVIFSDYHLFDKLYGIPTPDSHRINKLFREMELENKTRLDGEKFQTLDLSTGQRKRLALIVSMLEDKPVYIFDEWAADQDPHFRKKFYEELLEQLKAEGKTIIAVTHDDRYYHVADRVLKMDYGRFVREDGIQSDGRA